LEGGCVGHWYLNFAALSAKAERGLEPVKAGGTSANRRWQDVPVILKVSLGPKRRKQRPKAARVQRPTACHWLLRKIGWLPQLPRLPCPTEQYEEEGRRSDVPAPVSGGEIFHCCIGLGIGGLHFGPAMVLDLSYYWQGPAMRGIGGAASWWRGVCSRAGNLDGCPRPGQTTML
jgi:hypothetical protein